MANIPSTPKPKVVSNQPPIPTVAVTYTNAPTELVKKYRSRRPLRRPTRRRTSS